MLLQDRKAAHQDTDQIRGEDAGSQAPWPKQWEPKLIDLFVFVGNSVLGILGAMNSGSCHGQYLFHFGLVEMVF